MDVRTRRRLEAEFGNAATKVKIRVLPRCNYNIRNKLAALYSLSSRAIPIGRFEWNISYDKGGLMVRPRLLSRNGASLQTLSFCHSRRRRADSLSIGMRYS